ncbi:HIT domain-containing protein [Patescibacteria group bacterium]|nr:HIT domain-containing protein [Patescibacteria group bacterium]
MTKNTKYDFYCEEALSGKTPIKKLYESKTVLAFHHTKPSYEVHVVIIPKEHIPSLLDISDQHNKIVSEIFAVARDIAKTMNYKKKGVKLFSNLGKFQDSPHLHFHLVQGKKIK